MEARVNESLARSPDSIGNGLQVYRPLSPTCCLSVGSVPEGDLAGQICVAQEWKMITSAFKKSKISRQICRVALVDAQKGIDAQEISQK